MKKAEDRLSDAFHAVDAEDRTIVAARPPLSLSSMTEEAHALVRARASAEFAPLDSAQLDATDAVTREVMGSGNTLTLRFGDSWRSGSERCGLSATGGGYESVDSTLTSRNMLPFLFAGGHFTGYG
ncbi:hypothetical protein [Stakelama tenebrarum]|uniref:Uncharacterized protein n=1 Tax=Stakelama tenebrarum TaxID=2711215 RepID=A0A6G6Y6B9_9SPHN|nr:hypothetical protein [Sphingosinithalassobacter tenebrarum]QIG80391.1 hypothetical protein G5C33_11795 [Sphingosinithalassobacter tenebrarum]